VANEIAANLPQVQRDAREMNTFVRREGKYMAMLWLKSATLISKNEKRRRSMFLWWRFGLDALAFRSILTDQLFNQKPRVEGPWKAPNMPV
jgi:hypothetical protein